MIYFAHRGASARCVQNTVPAFLLARQLGATCYELDVHLTQDRQLAVLHDYSLREVAGKEVEIGHLLQTDLQKYPLRNRFSKEAVFIPLLKDVLRNDVFHAQNASHLLRWPFRFQSILNSRK